MRLLFATLLVFVLATPVKPKKLASLVTKATLSPNLVYGEKLGQGTYGAVYRGTLDDNQVAIKVMHRRMNEAHDSLHAEIEIMQKLSGEAPDTLLRLHDAFMEYRNGYLRFSLILDLVDGIHLGTGICERIKGISPYSERVICRVMKSVAEGLAYMHQQDIVHGDIKPENIMVCGQTGQVKIIDFGMSKEAKVPFVDQACSPGYASPELLQNLPHGKPHDLWCLGASAFEMHTGYMVLCLISVKVEVIFRYINEGMIGDKLREKIFGKVRGNLSGLSDSGATLIESLLAEHPEQRLTAPELIESI